ncbi:ATP-binding protein [Streptomyces sp. R302]|uniref:ATP-binding protein n=1 Tax=unclassified Streptomyces TaxID=2593676 RepID=UPI00145C8AFC|nr:MULTISPECIES: ATP-binding protein [unclassified Streptomyces]NML54252.1 ATP-binding protein [Streptomyces sp. R301]NML78426.1 ATP-binding protein [Streptomyces sp. R302]
MDPIHRGPDESGHDTAAEDARPTQPTALPDRTAAAPARARVTRIVSGGLLLTVNPVDGSEIEPCPPGETPPQARRRTPEERAEADRAAAAPVPPGPAGPELPLLERDEPRARLAETLTRGRSARLTGPDGVGRTALLDVVAADCADLAPDGVVRLSGHHRTGGELLHELRTAVLHAPGHRPDRDGLRGDLATVGAVVVVDDLEFGGAALDELLAAAPECAFLLAAAPGVPAPSAEARIEEVALSGLGRAASLALLEAAVGRRLTEEEANWAGDLWFESEGLPLRFVQAGALLRQRDRLRVTPAEFDAFGALEEAFGPSGTTPGAGPAGTAPDPYENPDVELHEVPLPSLGEGAAPAALLASRLSRSAQATLRFAVALGGELPHHAHLPALVGDTHADAALGELRACGLLSPAGARHRLAGGVLTQLLAHGYGHDTADRLRTAAQHYAWWAGHPSVGPERAAAESDALLAALGGLVGDGDGGPEEAVERRAAAVALARAAAPAFAAGLHWGAWERALRSGQEAARLAGDVAEEAYFHHELGILAICGGNLARARAELEASIGLRGALADKRGTVAGRRALALVADLGREREPATAVLPSRTDSPARGLPAVRATAPVPRTPAEPPTEVLPPVATTAGVTPPAFPAFPDYPDLADQGPTVAARPAAPAEPARKGLKAIVLDGTRRNLAAVGAGALLVAVLGTVVTLGATSDNDETPTSGTVSTDSTTDTGVAEPPDTGDGAPAEDEPGAPAETGTPTTSGSPGPTTSGTTPTASATDPTATGSPSTSASGEPDPTATSAPGTATGTTDAPTTPPTTRPTTTRPPSSPTGPKPSSSSPTSSPSASSSTPDPDPSTPSESPSPTPTPEESSGGEAPTNSASSTLDGTPTASDTVS